MQTTTVKLSSKGQVVIPLDIRQQLGLKQHDEFKVRIEENQIILEPSGSKKNWEDLEGSLKGGRSLTKWIEEERKSEKKRENQKLRSSLTLGQS